MSSLQLLQILQTSSKSESEECLPVQLHHTQHKLTQHCKPVQHHLELLRALGHHHCDAVLIHVQSKQALRVAPSHTAQAGAALQTVKQGSAATESAGTAYLVALC